MYLQPSAIAECRNLFKCLSNLALASKVHTENRLTLQQKCFHVRDVQMQIFWHLSPSASICVCSCPTTGVRGRVQTPDGRYPVLLAVLSAMFSVFSIKMKAWMG